MSGEQLIVGIDLGGTRFRVCLADRAGNIVRRLSRPTEAHEGPSAVIARMVAATREVLQGEREARVVGVGVGAPGPLDPWQGVVLQAPNLAGWVDVPLRDLVQSALGLPVYIGNDANLAALGETRFGAARGLRHVVYLTVSTGVGGGVIADGRMLLGARGLAAEIGHMVVQADGPLCGCGNRGCLEALASGTAIARRTRERIAAGEGGLVLELANGDPARVDARLVEMAAKQGDSFAQSVMAEAAYYLGIGVVNVLHLYDPELVVIGGGVSRAGELLFEPVRLAVRGDAMGAYGDRVRVVPAGLGDDAGLMGAVALVADSVS